MPRLYEEVETGLLNQMRGLGESIRSFSRGNSWEAARIATTVATIVYDRGKTISILTQLGERDAIEFLISGVIEIDGNLLYEFPLVDLKPFSPDGKIFPLFLCEPEEETVGRALGGTFSDWWTLPIYKTGGWVRGNRKPRALTLSRGELTLSLRDQDGGAHFDSDLKNEAYKKIISDEGGWGLYNPGLSGSRMIPGIMQASMAQVGWELMTSLLSRFPSIPTSV